MNHTTDPTRTALRDRIAAALYEHVHPGSHWSDTSMPSDWRPTYLEEADAVLAVLPPPADRAAVLLEAAKIADSLRQFDPAFGARKSAQVSENVGILRVADELRRLAAEAPQPDTEAHPPHHRWYTETRDGLADEWAPGMRFTNRAEALARYRTVSERHPLWKDGTPVERRFVRETKSYTVEDTDAPAAPTSQPAAADTDEETRP